MSKNTTRKKAASKTTAAKKTSPRKPVPMPEPMDPEYVEAAVAALPNSGNTYRICWSLKTLVSEVHGLFPEMPVEFSNVDGRNTALDATFDLTVLDESDRSLFRDLLRLCTTDERVREVISDSDQVLVGIKSNPRIQDSRDWFSLADAWLVMAEGQQAAEEPDDLDSLIGAGGSL